MEKREINLNEVNEVYDSIKELYLMYREEMDTNIKELESIADQRKELEAYISYLENNQQSDVFVFSPRGVVNKAGISGGEDKTEAGKVIDFTAKQKKQEELYSLKKKEDFTKKRIEQLEKNISLLEKNNLLLKELSQYYKDTKENADAKPKDSSDLFLKIYEADCKNITKHIQEDTLQTLSYVLHMSDLCEKFVDNDPVRAKLEMKNIHKNIQNAINQLREFTTEFLPYVSDNNQYSLALNQIIVRVKSNCPDLNVDLKIDEFDQKEKRLYCFVLLKIIMEYCMNTSKHSSAQNMSIEITNKPDAYEIKISDDGIGFDYKAALEKQNCNGLRITQDYISFLNGKLDFKSKENEGTSICVTVPKGDL